MGVYYGGMRYEVLAGVGFGGYRGVSLLSGWGWHVLKSEIYVERLRLACECDVIAHSCLIPCVGGNGMNEWPALGCWSFFGVSCLG